MLTEGNRSTFSQDAPVLVHHDGNDQGDWRYWATRITGTWQSSVAKIIETGELLNKAKASLPHGEFGDLIKKYLPFKQRTAQKLMKLARNPVLSKAAHVPHLPAHYGTLIALDTLTLPATELEAKIHDGTITARMERADVAKLKPKTNTVPRESAMMKLKQRISELERQHELDEEKLAAMDGGDLFNWKTTSAEKIAATIVGNVGVLLTLSKAKKIATEILKLLDNKRAKGEV